MRRATKQLTDALSGHRRKVVDAPSGRSLLQNTTHSTFQSSVNEASTSVTERIARSFAAGPSGRTFASSFSTSSPFSRLNQSRRTATTLTIKSATAARQHYYSQRQNYWSLRSTNWNLPSPKQVADNLKPSYEYILGTGYNARIAVINALYAMQPSTNWARMISFLMAEALTRGDPTAWCYRTPVTSKELSLLEEADAAAAAADRKRGAIGVVRQFLNNSIRLMWLSTLFFPVVAWAPFAFTYGLGRKQWMTLLRKTLEAAGPAFIKWGQWAATRHDLFPKDFCCELERLHTSAPAHSAAYTRTAIVDEFGFCVEDLFSSFDAEPVASGSIGQIHIGKLSETGARLTGMDPGTEVAVKVRHPNVSEVIERDFALMMAAAQITTWIPALASLRLDESLGQFAAPLREQVDLTREAYHLHAFNYNFRTTRNVSFPIPLYPLASPSVLVESYEGGRHIGEYVARGPGAPYNSDLAHIGTYAMLHMMLVDNLIHADLHPGNILVRLEPLGGRFGGRLVNSLRRITNTIATHTGLDVTLPPDFLLRPQMVFLDAGMATHLNSQDQINMVGLFESFSRLDGRCVADWVLRFAGEEQRCRDPDGFRSAVESRFQVLKEADAFAKGDTSNGAEALADVLEDVRQFNVTLPGHIVATVVTTLVLEGWSFNLDPAHSTLEEVKRIIKAKRGETKFRKAAAWVASAAEREILDHVPKFEPAPASSATLWSAWLDTLKDTTNAAMETVTGSSGGSSGGSKDVAQFGAA